MKTEALIIQTLSTGTMFQNVVTGEVLIKPKILTNAVISGMVTVMATIKQSLTVAAQIVNSGVSGVACPVITNIDGGNAFTVSYPSINGLLNGGTA